MRFRLEILIPVLFVGYVAYFPIMNGEIQTYFIKPYILTPFALIFIGLTVLSFGFLQFIALIKSVGIFFTHDPDQIELHNKCINGAISYAYVAAILWVMYALVINSIILQESSIMGMISDIALSFTYAFILAELILRPLKKRIEFLQN